MWSRHFESIVLSAGTFFPPLEGCWGKVRHGPVESHGLVGFLQRLARRKEETRMDSILHGAIHIVKNSGIFYRFSLLKKKKKMKEQEPYWVLLKGEPLFSLLLNNPFTLSWKQKLLFGVTYFKRYPLRKDEINWALPTFSRQPCNQK